jgi:hypothetical protein
MQISTTDITHAASLWYPIMLTQERGEISEAKAAELLGLTIESYREKREQVIETVMQFVKTLPSGLTSLLDILIWEKKT